VIQGLPFHHQPLISRVFRKRPHLEHCQAVSDNSETAFWRVRVVLTRESDNFVSGEERTTIANNNRADVFLSLHVNNTSSPVVSGFEVYVMDYGSLDLPEGYQEVSAQSQLLDYAQAKYIERQ